ncbi:hypothetical protein AAG906_010567 [Vitis piasezkii]
MGITANSFLTLLGLRIALEHQIAETDWLLRATNHMHVYQRKMVYAFKKRVKPKKFQRGDLVLRVLKGLIIRDVGRPLFLEDIEESHNAFSIQSPCLWAYPLSLHDDIRSYMYTCSPFHSEMFGISSAFKACPRSNSSIFIEPVGVYTRAYPMHCHVRVFRRMMVFEDAFS